jgi:hypothetical protein
LPHTQTPPPSDPLTLVNKQPYHKLVAERLQAASTREKRVAALTDLADEFLDEARMLPRHPDQVAKLARHFSRLVQHDLRREVGELSFGERKTVVPTVSKSLSRARDKAAHLAVAWQDQHPAAAASLRQIADAADEADRLLRRLVQT